MMSTKARTYVRRGDDVFCATEDQHDYVHEFVEDSKLGDWYQCRYCDAFQVG